TAEGANRVVTGTAVDNAGNTASRSVTLNIDKTRPAIEITSPANGATLSPPGVTVTGTVSDLLSGVGSVTCNGGQASLSSSTFQCTIPLSQGANTIVVQATDLAGNTRSESRTVNVVGVL